MLMSIKPLVILPDPLLRQVSKPVERFDADLRKFSTDMLDTMYDAPGIGLAAIQVGEPLRMLVIDLAKEDEPRAPQILINPRILSSSDERNIYEEGCFPFPTTMRKSSGRQTCGFPISILMARPMKSRQTDSWRRVSSTRSIISMAFCSSIIFRG